MYVHVPFRVFAVHLRMLWILGHILDCADMQSDLSFRWVHIQYRKKLCAHAEVYNNSIITESAVSSNILLSGAISVA